MTDLALPDVRPARSEYFPTPTAAESAAWLLAHPEEAAKVVGYVRLEILPFRDDEASTLFIDPEPDPNFDLSRFIDLARPVDYFVLHDSYGEACDALRGPQFRVAIKRLGPKQAAFWDRMIAAHYFKIIEGKEKPPKGLLMDGVEPEVEQPNAATPFLWWQKDSLWR